MTENKFSFKQINNEEKYYKLIYEDTIKEEWDLTRKDVDLLLEVSTGFLFLLNDEIIGHIAFTFYGDLAWVSHVRIEEKFRGKKYGETMFGMALNKIKSEYKFNKFALDAEIKFHTLYKKFSFELKEKIHYFEKKFIREKTYEIKNKKIIHKMSEDDLNEVIKIDKENYKYDRSNIIKNYYNSFHDSYYVVKNDDNKVIGFAMGRDGIEKYCFGTISINIEDKEYRIEILLDLINTVMLNRKEDNFEINTLEKNKYLIDYFLDNGFEKTWSSYRMLLGNNDFGMNENIISVIGGDVS
jgi:hypothetical protein